MPIFLDYGTYVAHSITFDAAPQLSVGGDGLTVTAARRIPLRNWPGQVPHPLLPSKEEPLEGLVACPGLDVLLIMVPTPPHVTAARTACQNAGLRVRWESLNTQVVGKGDLVSLLERQPVPCIVTRVGRAHLRVVLDGVDTQRRHGHLQQLILWGDTPQPPAEWGPVGADRYHQWPSGEWREQVKALTGEMTQVFGALWAVHPEVRRLQEQHQQTVHPKPMTLQALARAWSALEPAAPFSLYHLDVGNVSHYRVDHTLELLAHDDVWGNHSPGLAPPDSRAGMMPVAPLHALPSGEAVRRWLSSSPSRRWVEDTLANALLRPASQPANALELRLMLALTKELAVRMHRVAEHNTTLAGDLPPSHRILVTGEGLPALSAGADYLLTVLDVTRPRGVVSLYGDPHGLAPWLGGRLLEGEGLSPTLPHHDSPLPHLSTCLAPYQQGVNWKKPSDHTVAVVQFQPEGGPASLVRLRPGGVLRLAHTTGRNVQLRIEPTGQYDFGAGRGKTWEGQVMGGRWGLICDTRGRPLRLPEDDSLRNNRLHDWYYSLEKGV